MTIPMIVPWLAAAAFLAFSLFILSSEGGSIRNGWMFPAAASLAFFGFSLVAVSSEGMSGFWTEHTRNLWGNQIWIDLLLAVGIGWFLIVPQAKALGMRPLPWFLLVASTGCIGFLAMTARMLYLRERAGSPSSHPLTT
ncbi:MAG: hypothetical protein HC882_07775 [Acidobacteria bacterium]|nr:hypothetical protein [Acidobacteriota bacterium]